MHQQTSPRTLSRWLTMPIAPVTRQEILMRALESRARLSSGWPVEDGLMLHLVRPVPWPLSESRCMLQHRQLSATPPYPPNYRSAADNVHAAEAERLTRHASFSYSALIISSTAIPGRYCCLPKVSAVCSLAAGNPTVRPSPDGCYCFTTDVWGVVRETAHSMSCECRSVAPSPCDYGAAKAMRLYLVRLSDLSTCVCTLRLHRHIKTNP
jgi:hypothetical protein